MGDPEGTGVPPAAAAAGDEQVDGGCLPPWRVGELPDPPPVVRRRGLKAVLAIVGPGLVMAGSSIGTGEWVMGPAAAALYMQGVGAILWVVVASIGAQVLLNTEVMRYTLCTGEPMFTGILRTKPGPRVWLIFYLLLDCLSWWPALGGLAAQILLVAWFGSKNPAVQDPMTVRMVWTGVLLFCVFLLCFGGKVYNTLEWVLSGKVFFVLAFLVIVDLVFVHAATWRKIAGGFFNPFYLPQNIDWALVTALAGFAGVGGMGNIVASNFVREKGWGMGAYIGAIPSIFGARGKTVSHLGIICGNDDVTRRRFDGWWARLRVDQYVIWAGGSTVAMLLPCLLGAQFLKQDYFHGTAQWKAAATLAENFGAATFPLMGTLTLLCGLVILLPGQYGTMDSTARRWCDALWSGSRRMRSLPTDRIRNVYYSFIAAYTLFGLAVIWLRKDLSPPGMMVISANMANLAMLSLIFHTLYVNSRFLPPQLRPSLARKLAVAGGGLFFVTMFGLVTWQNGPAIVKNFGAMLSGG